MPDLAVPKLWLWWGESPGSGQGGGKKRELFHSARFTGQVFFFSPEMSSRAKLLVRSGGGWRFMKWTPRLFM